MTVFTASPEQGGGGRAAVGGEERSDCLCYVVMERDEGGLTDY